jgi:hypothetical protein
MRIITWATLAAVGVAFAATGLQASEASEYRARKARDRAAARAHHSERLTPDQREYERARAENVDPGGSYRDYPDWARYALSPKGGGNR